MSDADNQLSLSEAGAPGAVTSIGKSGKQQPVSPPVIANFEIMNKIGQGGMGAVFRARQISMDRIVALKILPKRLASEPQFKERFIREARLSAKLNHVNLINGIECGEDSGYTYFAMEYVDGCTAKQLLDNATKHFTPAEVLAIIRQIAEALLYAHSRSLIHRDVKPENIMVTSTGTAKLCDLGLARSLEENANDAHLTQAGQAVGTPFYISPEQAKGLKDLDARTDIYSLGATFYHLLTGQPPFQAPTAAAVMVKHLTESAPAACEVADDVPPEFAMVCCKMMAKAATDRYADVAALIRDLDALRDGKLPAAAEFRAKSSCAMPPKTGLRLNAAGDVSKRVTSIGTTRTKIKVQQQPRKSSPVPLIACGVVALAVAFFALRGSGTPKPVEVAEAGPIAKPTPSSVAPKPTVVAKPAPVKPAPAVLPKPAPTPAAVSSETVAAILSPATTKKTEDGGDTNSASTPEVPKVEPSAAKTDTEAPKIDPANVAKVEPAANPAAPAVDAAAETAYLRFLVDIVRKAATTNLSKVEKDARDLATKPEYVAGKDLIAAEIKDLENAVKYEAGALEELGKKKKTLDLPTDHVLRKFGSQVKIEDYDASRGLMVTVGGARMPLATYTIPATTINENASTRVGPLAAMYYFYRGDRGEVQKLLSVMPPQDRPPIERKMELIKTGDVELAARSTYSMLVGHIRAKQWKPFMEKMTTFEKSFSETSVYQEKMPELSAFKEFAEEILNPIGKIFNAKTAKQLPDGFVELTYDFSTPQQLQLFACEHGDLALQDGCMHVPPGGQEFGMARFIAPIMELRHMEIVGRGPSSPRFGIAFIPPTTTNYTDLNTTPRLVLRPYNRMAHVELWQAGSGNNRIGANAVGTIAQNWQKDTSFVLDIKPEGAVWTVGGEALEAVKQPATTVGGTFGFMGTNGNHFWSNFKIVFKPDPVWLAQQRAKAK
jgi:serine/threonine protein kinase